MHPAELKYPKFKWLEQEGDYGHETAIAVEVEDEDGVVVRHAVRTCGNIHERVLKPAVPLTDEKGEQLYRKIEGHYDDDDEWIEDRYVPVWKAPAKTRMATPEEVLKTRMSMVESLIDWLKQEDKMSRRLVAALEGKL